MHEWMKVVINDELKVSTLTWKDNRKINEVRLTSKETEETWDISDIDFGILKEINAN